MNRHVLIIALIIVLGAQVLCLADGLDEKRYGFKSGIVEYEITGSNQQGKEVLYFDDFGRREARYTNSTVSILGFKQSTDTVHYLDHEWSYNYDPKTNIATKINWKEMVENLRKNNSLREFGEAMMKSLGGRKTGSKTILGKSCDIWEIQKVWTETCIYKNSLPLETKVNMAGIEVHTLAARFEENTHIPADKIKLPKTAKIKEMKASDLAVPKDANGKPVDFSAMMQQMKDAQKKAQDEISDQNLSEKEMALKEKELELKQKELELKAQEMEQKNKNKGALEETNEAVNTTNNVKNIFNGLRSVLGR